jgi:hypothetical protein
MKKNTGEITFTLDPFSIADLIELPETFPCSDRSNETGLAHSRLLAGQIQNLNLASRA